MSSQFEARTSHKNQNTRQDSATNCSSTPSVDKKQWLKNNNEIIRLTAHIISFVSINEAKAIRSSDISGPPIDEPIADEEEFRRKFRWPLHLRNVRRKNFLQNPLEILTDYELMEENSESSFTNDGDGVVPQPLLECIASIASKASRKRKRPLNDDSVQAYIFNPKELYQLSKSVFEFTEILMAIMLQENAAALQGSAHVYSQSCWTRLPMSKKPIANWRFVFERLCHCNIPSLRNSSIIRVRDRLKAVYGLPWMDDDERRFFQLVDSTSTACQEIGRTEP